MENAARQLGSFLSNQFEEVKDSFRIRRPSFSPFSAVKQEPLIVVEESGLNEEDEQQSSIDTQSQKASLDIDSPVNPYLLSPWRDPREVRKHSLPTQQVTDGITASQVRRLSERGEGAGPSPKEAAFLATLSQAPAPSGRRHSVVTISKVPPTLFGRNRRESVAAYPLSGSRVLQSRRESGASIGPPSTDHLGSIHNLQLDVMDDILQTRKARMKLWTTSSEKVCEVQTVDEAGSNTTTQRYSNRRYSDFVGPSGLQVGGVSPSGRRGSDRPIIISPCLATTPLGSQRKKKTGLLGSRSNLGSIFSNLTSSAIEIHKCDDQPVTPSSSSANKVKGSPSSSSTLDPNIGRSTRSNSFDVSVLHNAKLLVSNAEDKSSTALAGWFQKRHQPIAKKKTCRSKSTAVALSKDMLERLQNKAEGKENKKSKHKNKSMVDPHVIGSAIEGFLRKNTMTSSSSSSSPSKGAVSKDPKRKSSTVRTGLNWFTKGEEDDSKDTCDSSLCSTLKDLFVK